MIPFEVRKYLGTTKTEASHYLYIIFPEEAVEVPVILNWIQENQARAVLSYFEGGKHILQVNDLGLKILTPAGIQLAIDNGAIFKSMRVPIGVEVNTGVLDADVPVGYSPDNETITEIVGRELIEVEHTDEEGNTYTTEEWTEGEEVTRQKTVRELMICIEGTEGKSLVLCAEKTNGSNGSGLVHEELLRFIGQFTIYEVFTPNQLSNWKENNIVVS